MDKNNIEKNTPFPEDSQQNKNLLEIKKSLAKLSEDLEKLKKWQLTDDMKQEVAEEKIQELRTAMTAFISELKTARDDFRGEVHDIKIMLAQEYMNREGFVKFSDGMLDALSKINDKIDVGCKEIREEVVTQDRDVENRIVKLIMWMVGTGIAIGALIATILAYFL